MSDPADPSRTRGHARAAILWAVVDIVAERGIDAVTHRRVASRAGVSPGSTTHHFASREDLLRSALRYYLDRADRLLTTITTEVEATTDDPRERVREFVHQVIHREFADERLIRAEHELLLYASGDPELAVDVRAWDARWVTAIAADLEAGGWPSAIVTARTIVNFIRGYEVERLLDPTLDGADLERRIDWLLAPRAAPSSDGR